MPTIEVSIDKIDILVHGEHAEPLVRIQLSETFATLKGPNVLAFHEVTINPAAEVVEHYLPRGDRNPIDSPFDQALLQGAASFQIGIFFYRDSIGFGKPAEFHNEFQISFFDKNSAGTRQSARIGGRLNWPAGEIDTFVQFEALVRILDL